jgi:hypothetical protein
MILTSCLALKTQLDASNVPSSGFVAAQKLEAGEEWQRQESEYLNFQDYYNNKHFPFHHDLS